MSNLNETPNSSRLQIAIFGRRNVGKSSLINALTNQTVALVSAAPGTTTDPVTKAMELSPLGPVALIDTAGIDDTGALGELRVERTYQVLNKTDLALLVLDSLTGVTDLEMELLKTIRAQNIPVVGVVNKVDLAGYDRAKRLEWQKQLQLDLAEGSATTGAGIAQLKTALIRTAPKEDGGGTLVGDLIKAGDLAVLVIPIDAAAPKGRLILPQQQMIREILDRGGVAITAKEDRLRETLEHLRRKPAIVITDSQAFKRVAAETPPELPLTSFSILFARYKGDLAELVKGVKAVKELRPGDQVLVAEGCTHHRQCDDIGTVKIPKWLRQLVGGEIKFEWASGLSMPEDLSEYRLVIHCGGCMLNRREMMYRIGLARERNVPVINYGVFIAYAQEAFPRALRPFPELKTLLEEFG
jgi:[FeFe] hydrogenase H-cluster maturation GTPase HydF